MTYEERTRMIAEIRLSNYKNPHPPDIETFHKCVQWLGVDHKDFFLS